VDRLTAGTLTAFTLRTSSGARRVTVSASTNSISLSQSPAQPLATLAQLLPTALLFITVQLLIQTLRLTRWLM